MKKLCIFSLILIPVFWGAYLVLNRAVPYPPPFNLYGISLATGAIAGYIVYAYRVRKLKLDTNLADDLALCAIIGGILGARLGYVLFYDPVYFWHHPLEIIGIVGGKFVGLRGLSIFGTIFGGLIAVLICERVKKIPWHTFLRYLDAVAPGILLGQAIGRWGNFFNRELWGYPTNVPWALIVPPERRFYEGMSFAKYSTFHPTFLYEGTLNLIGICLMLYVERKWKEKGKYFPGFTASLWFIWYGTVRFIIEFVRVEPKVVFGILTEGQTFGLIAVIIGVLFDIYMWKKIKVEKPQTEE
ncbi:prolipoprotein diacylglyceryl transferase [bacterium 3DAC]|nr:prolipoprotein diacylglyceryl transferase [bacterium 3DAC]